MDSPASHTARTPRPMPHAADRHGADTLAPARTASRHGVPWSHNPWVARRWSGRSADVPPQSPAFRLGISPAASKAPAIIAKRRLGGGLSGDNYDELCASTRMSGRGGGFGRA